MSSTTLESTDDWGRILSALADRPLTDVARAFEVSPGALAAALVRTRSGRRAVVQPGMSAELATPRPAAVQAAPAPEESTDAPAASDSSAAPRRTLSEHLDAWRAASDAGQGSDYLAGLHRLVRAGLRGRLARDPDRADLLARFDNDAPPRATAPAPAGKPETARVPDVQPAAPPIAAAAVAIAPLPHHVYRVTVQSDGGSQSYGVVAPSMADALRRTQAVLPLAVVIGAERGLLAL